MRSISFNVPAKINLYLRLTGKRPDGFNNLCTIFQKVNLFDHLTLTRRQRGVELHIPMNVPCPSHQNLVLKAYKLLKKECRFKGGLRIDLVKHIPAAAGLGGASADAAYTLIGMNILYKLRLNKLQMLDLGSSLGADVPFFIQSAARALGIERGDILLNLPVTHKYWVMLVMPDQSLSTATAYDNFRYPKRFRLNLTKLGHEVIMLSHFLEHRKLVSLKNLLKNDLAPVACSLVPKMKHILGWMKHSNIAAYSVTGSGPTVFALFSTRHEAETARRKLLLYRGVKSIVCQMLQ